MMTTTTGTKIRFRTEMLNNRRRIRQIVNRLHRHQCKAQNVSIFHFIYTEKSVLILSNDLFQIHKKIKTTLCLHFLAEKMSTVSSLDRENNGNIVVVLSDSESDCDMDSNNNPNGKYNESSDDSTDDVSK